MYLFDTFFGIVLGVVWFGFLPGLALGAMFHKYLYDDEEE